MTDDEAVAHGHRAEAELALTKPILDQLRAAIIERWASTGLDQTAHREKLFNAYSTIDTVEKALRASIDAGLVAKNSLEVAELLRPPVTR